MNNHTPKQFALQLSALLTLYTSVTALLILLFNLINIAFPDAVDGYYTIESAHEAVRGAIATLVIVFPAFLLLTRLSNQTRRKESGGEYTTLGRWLVYISLVVAGGVLVGNAVTLVLYFLNGEITIRFILKVIALGAVVKLACWYYWLDVRNHFKKNVTHAFYFAAGASLLVVAALGYGFMNIETPSQVREFRLDDQQIGDLQDMQWRIEEYYRGNETLPESLSEVYTVGRAPVAPEDRAPYRYEVTGVTTYELCATFAASSAAGASARSLAAPVGMSKNFNWEHEAGEWCFEKGLDGEYRM